MTTYRVVVTCLMYKLHNNRWHYLVSKRADDLPYAPGRWTVPGGGIEPEDYTTQLLDRPDAYGTIERALEREMREEVGDVKYGTLRLLDNLVFIRSDNVPVVCLSFLAGFIGGAIRTTPECVEHRWVTTDTAGAIDLIEDIRGEIDHAEHILTASGLGLEVPA